MYEIFILHSIIKLFVSELQSTPDLLLINVNKRIYSVCSKEMFGAEFNIIFQEKGSKN